MALATHRVSPLRSVPFALVGGAVSAVPNVLLHALAGPFVVQMQGKPEETVGIGAIVVASIVPAIPAALVYSGVRHVGRTDAMFFAIAGAAFFLSLGGPLNASELWTVRAGLSVMHFVTGLCITAGLISAGRG